MKQSYRLTKGILTVLLITAIIGLAVGCDNLTGSSSSSSGSPDNTDGSNDTAQVKLSGTISEGVGGSSLSALSGSTEYLILAVDELGNTTVAIAESGNAYELDVSRDRNTAIVVFRLPYMELIGALKDDSDALGMFSVSSDSTADLNVNSESVSLTNSSIVLQNGSSVFTEDNANGIDSAALSSDTGSSTDYITLTDFMPRPGTWAITYNQNALEPNFRVFELNFREDDGGTNKRTTIDFEYNIGGLGSLGEVPAGTGEFVDEMAGNDTARSSLRVIGPEGEFPARVEMYNEEEEEAYVAYPLHIYRGQELSVTVQDGETYRRDFTVRGIVGTIEANVDGNGRRDLPVLAVRQVETRVSDELTQDRTIIFIARYGALSYMLNSNPTWSQIETFINQNMRFGSFSENGTPGFTVDFAGSGDAIPGDSDDANLRDKWLEYMYNNREDWQEL